MDLGKSTLLKLMTKIIYPDKGIINTYGKLTRSEIDQRVEKIIEFSELRGVYR